MNIVEDPQFQAELLKRIEAREFSERTGVHCSDLLYCLNKQAMRRLHPVPNEDYETLLFSIGWSTQRWLTGQNKDEEAKIVDGVTVTCDARWNLGLFKLVYNHNTQGYAPETIVDLNPPWELKATYQSSDKDILENLAWFRQMMAQCYVLGVTTALLSRLEIMGNWKSVFGKKEEKELPENRKPTLHAYRVEFTQDELKQNWKWLLDRRDQFQQLLDGAPMLPKLLALAPGMGWLCKYCNYECQGGN